MTGHQWLEVLIGVAIALVLAWLLVTAALAISRPRGKKLQLTAAYRRFSSSGALRNRRLRLKMLVLAVLIMLNVISLGFLLSRAPGERAVESTSTQSVSPGGVSSSADPAAASGPRSGSVEEGETIQVDDVADSARPFETVRIQGTYRGGADTLLRVQRWEEGKWLAFPVPTKTDESGQFTTYVEFGQPGRYRLRVLDPGSGVTSKLFALLIKG
jgi:hypothetical protein